MMSECDRCGRLFDSDGFYGEHGDTPVVWLCKCGAVTDSTFRVIDSAIDMTGIEGRSNLYIHASRVRGAAQELRGVVSDPRPDPLAFHGPSDPVDPNPATF